jgi:hypothetical protein
MIFIDIFLQRIIYCHLKVLQIVTCHLKLTYDNFMKHAAINNSL